MSVGGGPSDVAKLPGVLAQVGEVAAPIYLVVTAMCVDTFLTGWQAMPVEEQSHLPVPSADVPTWHVRQGWCADATTT